MADQKQNTPNAPEKDETSIIHTMPKKFVTAHPAAHNVKHIGLLILFFGVIMLIAGLGGLYYYLDKTDFFGNKAPVVEIKEENTKTEEPVKTEEKTVEETSGQEQIPETNEAVAEQSTTTIEIATTSEEQVNTVATSTAVTELKTDQDTDGDGLTDLEETLLNTNPAAYDSDGDTFADLAELKGLYNPAGNGKIIVNPNIEKYSNEKFRYSLYYPKTWNNSSLTDNDSVIFQIPNGQFMQVIVQPNIEKTSLEDWYKKQFGEYSLKPEQIILKKGWAAIKNDDGMVYYLMNSNNENIFTINYSPGITNTISYRNIFDMMVMSLELK